MHPYVANDPIRSTRPSGVNALARLVAFLALVGLFVGATGPAYATTESPDETGRTETVQPLTTPSPSPSVNPDSLTVTAPASFVGANSIAPAGTATTGHTVTVRMTSPATADPICQTVVAGGAWECRPASVPNGAITLQFDETNPGGAVVDSATATVKVLGPPVIDGPEPVRSTGLVSGIGYPHAAIRVTLSGPSAYSQDCPAVLPNGYWSCALGSSGSLPDGTYTATARQGEPGTDNFSGASGPMTVIIDRTAPEPPVVTSPAAGTRIDAPAVTFAGTGESGGTVDVFVDQERFCSVTVVAGHWSCEVAGIPVGSHAIQALQRDAAGNYSSVSAPVTVAFGPAAATPRPGATKTPSPTVEPTPAPAPAPVPVPVPSETPDATEPPALPSDPSASDGPLPGSNWGTPTWFGAEIPTFEQMLERGNWLIAPLLALAFILLFALPLRALYPLVADRLRWRVRLTGRNQAVSADDDDDSPLVKPWVVVAGSIVGMAVLAALSGGIQPEPRYLRLVASIGLGLVILNGVGIALSSWLSGRWLGAQTWLRFVPGYLALAALAALASRVIGIEPPVILGIIIAATVPLAAPRLSRAMIGLAQLAVLTLLASGAWALGSGLGDVEGFWASVASETLAAICLAGFGSVVLLTLPIRALPGRLVYAWSKPVWAASTFAIVTLAALVLMPGQVPLIVGAFLLAAASGAVMLATWAWVRFVEPAN
ncbi:hypothetical protein [Salinibacterium sp. ZJ450]|uniref:hypothetical protein n=1 Tax=Salinibacterium sp. ZJ450 TaxID=2708338 RepID=UPI00142311BF|nr:hypothetical protein [Salinibacterium sp. ZJ450]